MALTQRSEKWPDAAHIKQEKKVQACLYGSQCSPVGLRTPKLPLQQDQGAAVASLEPVDEMKYQVPAPYSAPDVSPSGTFLNIKKINESRLTSRFQVVLDDDLYPVLFALAKLKERGKVVRLDPALVQRLTHY
ncbi:hypothetical protein GWK47_023350 [Chionoecetes opilio]|uniref:Uncharacterized protein n=1 Tax=Chionoecetes opilio TaxID=41210 RepID=A0A8J5CD55_CHIOP|nr:hypothetical protein GWK47_023350 [Chionoecetes opilio]